MILRNALGRLAAGAPVSLFAIAGAGAREAVQDLRLRQELCVVDTPRAASLLVVAGNVPEGAATAVARLHDAMTEPRATLLWAVGETSPRLPGTNYPVVDGDPVPAMVATYRGLVTGRRASEPPILPDVDPVEWRGVGPYGQGGTGMTGGTPYGRPLAEVAPDRDGLRLDVLPLTVGPFFPGLPPGLVLDVTFAGDVVAEAAVAERPVAVGGTALRPGLRPFFRALEEPVPIAELELARARQHLRWLSDALIAHGLEALGIRALELARTVREGDGPKVQHLAVLVRLSQVMRWSTGGVGILGADELVGSGAGPVARAAGVAEDVRLEDPVYRELGFRPVLARRGDAAARWHVRLSETAQSVDLATRAGDRETGLLGRVESPRGRLEVGSSATGRLLDRVPDLVQDMEWGDTVATLVSLDLDLDEAAHAGAHADARDIAA